MDVKVINKSDAKELTLTNSNGKCLTISAEITIITEGISEPVIMIENRKPMAGLLALGSGTHNIDMLIAGLYEIRAHYRKLGGK